MATVESVWDYPRPPALVATSAALAAWFNGVRVAATTHAYRVLETSHPPTYYFPPADVREDCLRPNKRRTRCEFKGQARYCDLIVGEAVAKAAVWYYPAPTAERFRPLAGYYAFYPAALSAAYVDGEPIQAQAGAFYGGWITAWVKGPFKGEPGTQGW